MKTFSWLKWVGLPLALTASMVLLAWAILEGRKELALERERERPVQAPSRLVLEGGESVVMLDTTTRAKSGIETETLKPATGQETVKVYGTVLSLSDLLGQINAHAAAKAQFDKARAVLEASSREYKRLHGLHGDQRSASDKALEAARAQMRGDGAALRAAEETLRVVRASIAQQWGDTLGRWLLEGSPALARLVKQEDRLIQVTLPLGRALAQMPQQATAQTADNQPVALALVSAAPRTDPRFQGRGLFYLASAKTGLLPGMNVAVDLPTGKTHQGVLAPESAVVRWQGKAWVYRQVGEGRFVRHEIAAEHPAPDSGFVTDELTAGERLVVRGAQLLLSEELRTQITVGEENKPQ